MMDGPAAASSFAMAVRGVGFETNFGRDSFCKGRTPGGVERLDSIPLALSAAGEEIFRDAEGCREVFTALSEVAAL